MRWSRDDLRHDAGRIDARRQRQFDLLGVLARAHYRVERAVQTLRDSGFTYEQDGALWLRSTDFGDDIDRPLKKSDGSYTYFASDIAYHRSKICC